MKSIFKSLRGALLLLVLCASLMHANGVCSDETTVAETDLNVDHALAAFNEFSGRYLVVWIEVDGPVTNVLGRFVDEAGQTVSNVNLGIWTFVDDSLNVKSNPTVAFLRATNQYLVSWEEEIDGSLVIMAIALSGNGVPIGQAILVTNDVELDQTEPVVAGNERDNEFVIAHRSSNSIVLSRIDANTATLVSQISVSTSGDDSQPYIIWSQSQLAFLLVTRHLIPGNNQFDLVVRRLTADLSLISETTIVSSQADEQLPVVFETLGGSANFPFVLAFERLPLQGATNAIVVMPLNAAGESIPDLEVVLGDSPSATLSSRQVSGAVVPGTAEFYVAFEAFASGSGVSEIQVAVIDLNDFSVITTQDLELEQQNDNPDLPAFAPVLSNNPNREDSVILVYSAGQPSSTIDLFALLLCPPDDSNNGLSAGAVAGIVIVVIAACCCLTIVVIAGAIYCKPSKGKTSKSVKLQEEPEESSTQE